MKRIAIFGDSFADPVSCAEFNDDLAWPDLLKQQGIAVHNYAQSGSSLFYSWKKYYHFKTDPATWPLWNNCDAIIFVMTGCGREKMTIGNETFWLTSLSQIEVLRNYYQADNHIKKIFDSIHDYWTYVKDQDQDYVFHNLLVEKIKSEPKIFYLQAFSSDDEMAARKKLCLCDASMKEIKFWYPEVQNYRDELDFFRKYRDQRKCHLSAENNAMLAEKIYQALLSGEKTVYFDETDIRTPSNSAEYYFKEHKF